MKIRLDQALVARHLAESRHKAQALIMAAEVRVNGHVLTKPGTLIDENSTIEVIAGLPYVSRGGQKLAHALDEFGLSPDGLIALDVGASTGGFTHVLLQRGAQSVYAVDVGYGILHWRLRQDPRVVVLERTNIRWLDALPRSSDDSPTHPACATVDVSFISLRLILPAIRRIVLPDAWIVALVKPQFEAGRADVGKGGVVRNPAIHRRILAQVAEAAASCDLGVCGITRSPLVGPAGNVEFLMWLQHAAHVIDIARVCDHLFQK